MTNLDRDESGSEPNTPPTTKGAHSLRIRSPRHASRIWLLLLAVVGGLIPVVGLSPSPASASASGCTTLWGYYSGQASLCVSVVGKGLKIDSMTGYVKIQPTATGRELKSVHLELHGPGFWGLNSNSTVLSPGDQLTTRRTNLTANANGAACVSLWWDDAGGTYRLGRACVQMRK